MKKVICLIIPVVFALEVTHKDKFLGGVEHVFKPGLEDHGLEAKKWKE